MLCNSLGQDSPPLSTLDGMYPSYDFLSEPSVSPTQMLNTKNKMVCETNFVCWYSTKWSRTSELFNTSTKLLDDQYFTFNFQIFYTIILSLLLLYFFISLYYTSRDLLRDLLDLERILKWITVFVKSADKVEPSC